MHYHNVNHKELSRDKKVQALMAQVGDFKKLMGRNINIILENQTQISSLMEMSEDMQMDAQVFKKKSTQLVRKKKRKLAFGYIIACGIVLVLIYLTLMMICGPRMEYCLASNHYNDNNNNNNKGNNAQDGGGNGGNN